MKVYFMLYNKLNNSYLLLILYALITGPIYSSEEKKPQEEKTNDLITNFSIANLLKSASLSSGSTISPRTRATTIIEPPVGPSLKAAPKSTGNSYESLLAATSSSLSSISISSNSPRGYLSESPRKGSPRKGSPRENSPVSSPRDSPRALLEQRQKSAENLLMDLKIAIDAKNEEAVKALLDLDNKMLLIDINYQDEKKWSLLHRAVYKGNTNIVRLLIRKNIDANLKDCTGQTALHLAVFLGNKEIVDILTKDSDADILLDDNKGRCSLDISMRLGDEIITDLLAKRTAALEKRPNYCEKGKKSTEKRNISSDI